MTITLNLSYLMEKVKTEVNAAYFFQEKGIITEKICKKGHPMEQKIVRICTGVAKGEAAMRLHTYMVGRWLAFPENNTSFFYTSGSRKWPKSVFVRKNCV